MYRVLTKRTRCIAKKYRPCPDDRKDAVFAGIFFKVNAVLAGQTIKKCQRSSIVPLDLDVRHL